MSNFRRDRAGLLRKLKIESLNAMQEKAMQAIHSSSQVIILSPTGSGKTIAFLLPIIESLDPNCTEIQALILVPSRELAIQINQVIRDMGSGFKTNAVYGGKSGSKDKMELKHRPAILVGTPGRVADHFRRHTFSTEQLKYLVLDEFDKSLEVGFEVEMKTIISSLFYLKKRILTSATKGDDIPSFVGLTDAKIIDNLGQNSTTLKLKTILSPAKDKLPTLAKSLNHIGEKSGIIFCNYKDSINRVSEYLSANKIPHGCFYGGMDQIDRERTLLKFRNGTHRLIIATDLAARGIDVAELQFIIHYQLPFRKEEFIHRNGRTARMNAKGTAFVLQWKEEALPEYIDKIDVEELIDAPPPKPPNWKTLYISGGRKDKISKGDIAGFFFKQGELEKSELGIIELKDDCAFVAVSGRRAFPLCRKLNNSRLKTKKVRVQIA